MVKSAYIHIPFCLSKCRYCSFVSFDTVSKKTGYLYSLLKEIDYYYQGELLDTLYFGGGTPSLMTVDELNKILKKFNYDESTEITIEVNPDSVDKEYLKGLKEIGFNRLSIGSQTFDDKLLSDIGRRHNSQQILDTIEFANEVGFENVSIDLIYGLPNQTLDMLKNDLEIVKTLDITHVSLYGLKIDEGCYFYNHYPKNVPDDDTQADMYLEVIRTLNEFQHYEISNFAKQGYESKHNLNYWREGEYYGFGVSAHGFIDGVRYSNYQTLEQYMDNPVSHEFGKFLTEQEKLEESIFLGFRIAEGVDEQKINQKFGINFSEKYKNTLEKYISTGHLIKTDKGYRLSDEGFLISNLILSEFI